jgi:hypothetical protein
MPSTPRARRSPALLLLVVAASLFGLVATALSTPALAGAPHTRAGATPAKAAAKHDRTWRANAALARARKALSPSTPAKERPDATLALRNLWLLQDSLSPADQAVARSLSARPSKPATIGDEHILVHYDPAELNPAAFDQNTVLSTMQNVANTYAGSGYRRPKPDSGKGGDNRVDIYIDSLEPGLYGYCTIDKAPRPPHFDVPAFCVLDNDYAGFPFHTPVENLQVTAAHEYYHATQFAYDVTEDGWFLEATATWAEDELYDTVNDNVQYLRRSPITMPGRSMDKFDTNAGFHYGVWNFFRFLTERHPAKTGALPGLLVRMWKYADASKGPRKDRFSTQAINKALRKEHTSLSREFTLYSAATRLTHVFFNEGAEQNYPTKPLSGHAGLAAGKRKTFNTKLDHLTSATYQFVPGGGTSKLKLRFTMAPKSAGSRAIALIYRTDGTFDVQTVKINRHGKGAKKVAFDSSVSAVDVTLVNAGTKVFECYQHVRNPISCSGKSRNDNERARVQGKAS